MQLDPWARSRLQASSCARSGSREASQAGPRHGSHMMNNDSSMRANAAVTHPLAADMSSVGLHSWESGSRPCPHSPHSLISGPFRSPTSRVKWLRGLDLASRLYLWHTKFTTFYRENTSKRGFFSLAVMSQKTWEPGESLVHEHQLASDQHYC